MQRRPRPKIFKAIPEMRGRNEEGDASVLWVETVEARMVAGRIERWQAGRHIERKIDDGWISMDGKENRRKSLRIL
jgi:hypothetical protein